MFDICVTSLCGKCYTLVKFLVFLHHSRVRGSQLRGLSIGDWLFSVVWILCVVPSLAHNGNWQSVFIVCSLSWTAGPEQHFLLLSWVVALEICIKQRHQSGRHHAYNHDRGDYSHATCSASTLVWEVHLWDRASLPLGTSLLKTEHGLHVAWLQASRLQCVVGTDDVPANISCKRKLWHL